MAGGYGQADQSVPSSASPIRGPEDFAAAFGVSRETLDRLATYEQLLRQWQKTINLVAPSTLDAIWHRHFADSAQLLPLAPKAANLDRPRLRRRLSGLGGGDMLAETRRPSPLPACGERVRGGGQHNVRRAQIPPPLTLSPQGRGEGELTPASPSSKATPASAPSCARWSGRPASPRASLWISCRQESRWRRLKLVCSGPDVVSRAGAGAARQAP